MNFRSVHAQIKRMRNYVKQWDDVQSVSLFTVSEPSVVVSNDMFMHICENFAHSEVMTTSTNAQYMYMDGVMYITILEEASNGNTEE